LSRTWIGWCGLCIALAFTCAVYWPGLSGTWLFDDYPNIVENEAVQPNHADLPSLVNAVISSPASEFKRPLASLSFAVNYLATGLDPYWMKLTNVVIHLLNGLLVFLLARRLLWAVHEQQRNSTSTSGDFRKREDAASDKDARQTGLTAALIAAAWMLLPINLTAVLYVVQRMESMANLFVLLGLIGYVAGRYRMLGLLALGSRKPPESLSRENREGWKGFMLCAISITLPTALGATAKETAVMLPLYAILIEWSLFHFRMRTHGTDHRLSVLFAVVLVLPMIAGLAWLLPHVLPPANWATRDFTLGTRLLSETRIVIAYIVWTLLPEPQMLSFYHDDFHISTGLFTPWTTFTSIVGLVVLIALILWLRRRRPLVSLGIALFLGCQLLTATILPLELIYEHRNYFASFGLMLAIVPWLTALSSGSAPFALPRRALLASLLLLWSGETLFTAMAWGNPLRLAQALAARAHESPRAQYELGRTYIIYSQYDPLSPFVQLAYAPLERAAALPGSSILPEQALIFLNARMHRPLKAQWWNSMIVKLKSHKPGVQDESSLGALTQCATRHECDLPKQPMTMAYLAALSHPNPSARLLAMYSDYAWNVLGDHTLGLRMIESAVAASPTTAAYRITEARMYIALGQRVQVDQAIGALEKLNIGGSLTSEISELKHASE